jgi:hypothetical protein
MQKVFGSVEVLSTETILRALHALDESAWADIKGKPLNDRGLAARLRAYEIKPKTVRIGDSTPRGYARADFVDAWARYLGSPLPEAQQAKQPQQTRGSSD